MRLSDATYHADLEIRILPLRDGGYPVEITFSGEREFPAGSLSREGVPWVPRSSLAHEEGERLFRWLLDSPELRSAWAEARGESPVRRVRLRIDPQAPELHRVPWELLVETPAGEPPVALAASSKTPFSRYLAGPWRHGRAVSERPLRLLVAIASPEDLAACGLSPVDVELERRNLEEALADAGAELEVSFLPSDRRPGPVTLPDLEKELRRGYHMLHLVTHGRYDAAEDVAYLCLAGAGGRIEPVPDRAFAAMLARQGRGPQLVFLASCESAARSSGDALRGLAPRLIAAGVPAVLAMQDRVPVATARTFARGFYRRLLAHGLVDLAANEARSALWTAELPGSEVPGSAIPVLFLRLRDGRLFAAPDPPVEDRRPEPAAIAPPASAPPPRRWARWTAGAALLAVLAATAFFGLYGRRSADPSPEETLAAGLAVPCRYAGAYFGTFVGGDAGIFLVVVDALTGDLTAVAGSVDPEYEEPYWFTGEAVASADRSTVAIRGTGPETMAFRGRFTSPDSISGTWENPDDAISGPFTGRRIGSGAVSAYRFTALYRGTLDLGVFVFDVDRSDAVTLSAYSILDARPTILTGTLSGTALSAAGDDLEITGILDRSVGLLTGFWTNGAAGSFGTFSGSGCRLD